MDKNLIIEKAREFIDTPYEHQGRLKGIGIDCCGLIICVAHELKISDYDIGQYDRWADGVDLIREFTSECNQATDWGPGDILLFTIGKIPRHCGIVGSKDGNVTLIHAYSTIGRCVEHNLDKVWLDRIFQGFAFKSKDLYQTNAFLQS
jgi:cell wall-associated NlpC family hydrolase